MGGLHGFMDWSGHILTDSGGYQVFSLSPKIGPDSVTFKSVYDGSYVEMSPEISMQVQQDLGADIAMAFDICSALPATPESLSSDVDTTLRWAQRCLDAHNHETQALFGICQGGTNLDLRAASAAATVELGFDGYAIGGLSVGESRPEMIPALRAAIAELPADKPRYFMGLGDPIGLVEAVRNGVDMFDCVLPTRLARHGTALTTGGRINLKNAKFANDDSPIDPDFKPLNGIDLASRYSRAYVRHLLSVGEPTAGRIITLHNLSWLIDFVARMREAIFAGSFAEFAEATYAVFDS